MPKMTYKETCIYHILTNSSFRRDSKEIEELDITDDHAVRRVTNYTYKSGVTPCFSKSRNMKNTQNVLLVDGYF